MSSKIDIRIRTFLEGLLLYNKCVASISLFQVGDGIL